MTNRTVLDVGCGDNPDPRATVTADIREETAADYQFDARDTWPFDDNAVDGVILNHVVEHSRRDDVEACFREAARVLRPAGWLEVSVPVGVNYRGDLDHEHEWDWRTPEQFLHAHRDGWDPDVPFVLADRDVDGWFVPLLGGLTPVYQALLTLVGGGRWATAVPLTGGELTARYTYCAGRETAV